MKWKVIHLSLRGPKNGLQRGFKILSSSNVFLIIARYLYSILLVREILYTKLSTLCSPKFCVDTAWHQLDVPSNVSTFVLLNINNFASPALAFLKQDGILYKPSGKSVDIWHQYGLRFKVTSFMIQVIQYGCLEVHQTCFALGFEGKYINNKTITIR